MDEMTQLKNEKKPSALDPQHYQSLKPEPITVIESWDLDHYQASALAYVARAHLKGQYHDDMMKAANYCYRAATGKWITQINE